MKPFYKILTVLLLLTSTNLFSKDVSKEDCQRAATKFFIEQMSKRQLVDINSIRVENFQSIDEANIPIFYSFNFNTGGFVIISADDAAYPILGYSYEGTADLQNIPNSASDWFARYKEQISLVKKHNTLPDEKCATLWADLLNGKIELSNGTRQTNVVSPLLVNILWNQDSPYNALCPVDAAGPGGRAYAGCVATAMSMVMYYWRYPKQGTSSHTYSCSPYGSLTANFASTQYNWNGMLDQITALTGENNAIAQLQYHAGVSVEMGYAGDGSGAQTSDCANALKTYFKYATDVKSISRSGGWGGGTTYTDASWAQVLKDNFALGRPILYSGYPSTGGSGHAFVCDGFEDTDHFHFNFGWNGQFNGYYYLNNINLGPAGYEFTSGQQAVVNIHPLTTSFPYGCTGTTTLTDRFGTIEDGSGEVDNYTDNNNCSWLISPTDGVSAITLSFFRFDTEATNDVVTVYDGADASAPVLGTFSGTSLPTDVVSTGNKMFIKFSTNDSINSKGWLAKYSSAIPVYCNTNTTLTAPSGSFDDGSGTYKYNNSKVCVWNITPPGATSITLNFSEFKTENTNDIVKVYSQNPSVLLASYSGTTIPPATISTTGSMRVVFTTNSSIADQGWVANYTSTSTGIDENTILSGFTLYPNPTSDNINIAFTMKETQNIKVDIFNVSGKLVYSEIINNCSGEISKSINTQKFATGMYQLKISGLNDALNRRFIVE
ncbi:MAG: C10 family peptidase [Bacteroidota bacterium]